MEEPAINPQINTTQPRSGGQSNRPTEVQNTFWIAVGLSIWVSLFALYTFYLYFQIGAWQLLVTSIAELICGGAIAYSAYLSRRGKVDLAVGIVVGGLMVLGLIASSLLANVGLVVGFAIVIATWAMTAQVPDQKWTNSVLITGFIIGIVAGALEIFTLPTQLIVPQLHILAPGAAISIVLVFFALIFWQFGSFNLQTKFVTIFFVVSMISVGIVAYLNNRTTSADLTRHVGSSIKSLAISQSGAIGDLLDRQVDNLLLLSLNAVLQARIQGRNSTYVDSPTAIEIRLRDLDELWTTAGNADPYIQSHFNLVTNAGALELAEFSQLFPDHVEVFATDRYGGLVAATNRTSDYYQADQEWWQAAFNNGIGAVYIGQPSYDESSSTLSLRMAVPIYDTGSGELLGILRTTYRVQTILDLLDRFEFGQTGKAQLYLPGGREIETDFYEDTVLNIEPEALAQVFADQVDVVESVDDETPVLVSAAPVNTATENPTIENLDWTVIVFQSRQEALASLQAQLRNTLFSTLVIIGLMAIAAVILAQILTGPIMRLTAVAQQVAAGDLAIQGRVESDDEIGQLTVAFNTMTDRLRETIDTLEMQVAERTQQLQTAVEVSRHLVGILDLSDLMRQVVILTKETFNYYHVHIYLREGETLLMAEGYGQAGAEMKRQGHHIMMDAPQSLVARSARERQVIIVENVRTDPTWLPNPLLPDTHSEMAVAVLLDDEVVGVLDVQSEDVGGLTHEDEAALRLLANQIAIAVRNARIFSRTQDALYEAQRLQRLYTAEAWEQFRSSRTTTAFESRQPTVPSLDNVTTPEAVAALQQEKTVTLIANGQHKFAESLDETGAESQPPRQAKNSLATPLKLRDGIIGVLGLHDENPERRWTEEEITLIEAVSEQMSLALENARLFEHTQRDAWRNKIVSETTTQVWASADIEEVMKAAVAELGHKLKASEVVIRLGTEDELKGVT